MEQNASPKRSRPVPRVQKPLEERFLAVNPLSRWADHPILLAVSGVIFLFKAFDWYSLIVIVVFTLITLYMQKHHKE